jgi:hypothetical protein
MATRSPTWCPSAAFLRGTRNSRSRETCSPHNDSIEVVGTGTEKENEEFTHLQVDGLGEVGPEGGDDTTRLMAEDHGREDLERAIGAVRVVVDCAGC